MSARKDRMAKCLVDLSAYKYDPAILRMTLVEAGAFLRLLLALWWMPEPGVVEADQQLLQRLAETTPEEWASVREALSLAFDTESRPGFWVDPRMVASHEHQTRWRAKQSAYGRAGAKAKAERCLKGASRDPGGSLKDYPSGSGSGTGSGAGSGSGSGTEKRKNDRASRSAAHPSLDEVRAYCRERRNVVDPQTWFDHYEANGWKVGKNAMKDWRAAVRTWEKNGVAGRTPAPVERPNGPDPALEKAKRDREEWEREQEQGP